jgi:uncharacterized membrane protein
VSNEKDNNKTSIQTGDDRWNETNAKSTKSNEPPTKKVKAKIRRGLSPKGVGRDWKTDKDINAKFFQQTKQEHITRSYFNPLPPPEDLAKYKSMRSDMPHRILCMAEKKQDKNIKIEQLNTSAYIFGFKIISVAGLVIPILLIVVGFIAILLNKSNITAIFGCLSTVAGILISGQSAFLKKNK